MKHLATKFNRLGLFLCITVCVISGCQTRLETPRGSASLRCQNAHQWANQVVGDGHCVALIKLCSGAPPTADWRPGAVVRNNALATGTVIATFRGDQYPSETGYHAAIYIRQDEHGIWVWDQWVGKPVHQRLIRWQNPRGTAANTGNEYRVVLDASR